MLTMYFKYVSRILKTTVCVAWKNTNASKPAYSEPPPQDYITRMWLNVMVPPELAMQVGIVCNTCCPNDGQLISTRN